MCVQVFVEDMMEHPNNGYALLGLTQVLTCCPHSPFGVYCPTFGSPAMLHDAIPV